MIKICRVPLERWKRCPPARSQPAPVAMMEMDLSEKNENAEADRANVSVFLYTIQTQDR